MKRILLTFALLLVFPAAAQADQEFIIGFDRGVSRSEQLTIIEDQGAAVKETLPGRAVVVNINEHDLAEMKSVSEVRYVEANSRVKTLAALLPTDPQLDDLWGIKRVESPAGWAKTTTNAEVVVAVSDTGIWAQHEDLKNRLWVNGDEIANDGLDNDNNGVVDDIHGADLSNGGQSGQTADGYGHGTHVAGTIGADGSNDLGVVGVAPNVKLMNARFLDNNGYGQIGDAARSIDYAADNGAKIINCSWGTTSYSQTINDAITRARAKGVLIIAAAGNSSQNADQFPMYPAAYVASNVISVAATTSADKLASFSNYGATSVDLGAPGQTIRSTIVNGGSGYNSGTSMATPHVSGIAAVLWGERPSANYWTIREAIINGGSPLSVLQGKTVSGNIANLSNSIDYLLGHNDATLPTEPTTPTNPPSEPTPEPNDPPTNPGQKPSLVQTPKIRGSATAPSNLYCDGGWWSGSTDVHVTWVSNGQIIGYGSGYSTGDKDIGRTISCRSIAYNSFGNTSSDSEPITIIANSNTNQPSAPSLISDPRVKSSGKKYLSCDKGEWVDASRFSYQWVFAGKVVAERRKVKIRNSWRGRKIYCRVTAYNSTSEQVSQRSKSKRVAKLARATRR